MTVSTRIAATRFFPAVICAEFDSPIDALVALCVPRDEAMDRVTASWSGGALDVESGVPAPSLLATVDGGRCVAVVRTADGRWAACNAFTEYACSTQAEAERRLQKLLKRGRRGCIGVMAAPDSPL